MRRPLVGLALCIPLTLLGGDVASARELVDDDRAQCPTAPHTTIQAGVDAASAGETVEVCNGTYAEAVVIAGPAKDGVRLRARVVLGASITAPDDYFGAIVRVDGADRAEVSRFRILGPFTGPGGVGCPTENPGPGNLYGVHVTQASTGAQVLKNFIDQTDTPSGTSCPFFPGMGVGVDLYSSARVGLNRIEDYRTTGVAITNFSFGHVDQNEIVGDTVNPPAGNDPEEPVGVLAFNGVRINLNSSSISRNHYGVSLEDNSSSDVRVANNRVFENIVGVELRSDSQNARVRFNRVVSNAQEGIRVRTPSSFNNIFEHNDARGNGGTDCSDVSTGGAAGNPFFGTGNRWISNRGLEASPPGICKP